MGKMKEQAYNASGVDVPEAYHDFYKTNGTVNVVMPGGASLARQEFAEEADINEIMRRYERTGVMPAYDGREPMYVDWTAMPTDLMGAMHFMHSAEDAFMQLPAVVRKEFDNDPIAFADYASDPANVDQMREWGLAKPKEEPKAPLDPAESPPPKAPEPKAPEPPPVVKTGPTQ